MELRVLRYFLAVAREESISAAAEMLHLTQPTLSRQLMELEAELGVQLLHRGKRNRGVTLTDAGMLLRRRAEEIVALAEKTEAEIQSTDELVSGDVHIGGGESDAMRLVAKAAKTCMRRIHSSGCTCTAETPTTSPNGWIKACWISGSSSSRRRWKNTIISSCPCAMYGAC